MLCRVCKVVNVRLMYDMRRVWDQNLAQRVFNELASVIQIDPCTIVEWEAAPSKFREIHSKWELKIPHYSRERPFTCRPPADVK